MGLDLGHGLDTDHAAVGDDAHARDVGGIHCLRQANPGKINFNLRTSSGRPRQPVAGMPERGRVMVRSALSVGLSNAHFKSLGLPSLIEAR
jgi:hypothetical protein